MFVLLSLIVKVFKAKQGCNLMLLVKINVLCAALKTSANDGVIRGTAALNRGDVPVYMFRL